MRGGWISRASAVMAAVAAAVVVAAGTGLGASNPVAAHGACRSTTERVTGLSASGRITCGAAQRVAAAYDTAVMTGRSFPGAGALAVEGFRCTTTSVGHESEETFSVRCAGRRGEIRFAWGV